jgi:hypothetical protein
MQCCAPIIEGKFDMPRLTPQPIRNPSSTNFRIALFVAAGFALSGCASLSQKQCRSGDWEGIGFRDGTNGYTEFRVTDHQDACGKYNIVVDIKKYEFGRQRGLELYCTIAGGLRAGRNGDSYAGVCAPDTEGAFLRAFQLGLEINRVESRLNTLRSERSSIYYRLHELDEARRAPEKDGRNDDSHRDDHRDDNRRRDDHERDGLVNRLRDIERQEWDLESDYRQLEFEARRLR